MAQSGKPWEKMTADEKADLVHQENRQLYELLNQQGARITTLENEIRRIKKALEQRQILIE